ncbi:MAG: aldo/keto reductase [Muribaculaceae bacterium]|nr:aldo/keto reductase [Muribaculaceae bacterium]
MNQNINRRDFLKRLSIGASVTGLALAGCDVNNARKTSPEQKNGEMTYRTNPTTGDKVSLLGYGCMRWPTKTEKTADGNSEEIIDQDAVNDLVDHALANGVNYFDTAPPYCRGLSEKATGTALARHPRESYYLATKMSNHRLAGNGLSPQELYDASVKMYRKSFEDLQTDYFDYYLLHIVGGGSGMPLLMERFFDNGLLDFLLEERKAGRIRNLGFSYHGDVKVFDYLLSRHDEFKWDFVQIQLNYVDFRHASGMNFNAEYLYGELDKLGIPAIVMEPLLGGRLTSLTEHLNGRLKQRRPDDSIASWAFRFAGSFPNVLTVLSGMTYMEHLQDNISTYSPLEPCDDEEMKLLEDTAQIMIRYQSVPCTSCQYCMPCPYGINIPGIFSHYNKCINEGNVPASSQSPEYRKARRAFLIGYDRSVPRLRQASHCIGCGQCLSHCPQSIDIPTQMQRIDNFVEQLKQNTL